MFPGLLVYYNKISNIDGNIGNFIVVWIISETYDKHWTISYYFLQKYT